MLQSLRTRAKFQRKAGEIYGAIVTQARRPEFYSKIGIPDTPAGRYEMVVLHLFLVLERLSREAPPARALSQALIEAFVADMDDSLREMGTGDMAVAKKVRRAAAGFYERAGDYKAALATVQPGELERTLARHVLVADGAEGRAGPLAAYVRRAAQALVDQDGARMMAGEVAFPCVAEASP